MVRKRVMKQKIITDVVSKGSLCSTNWIEKKVVLGGPIYQNTAINVWVTHGGILNNL